MLDTLLWRCPICKTQDALCHTERPFRKDFVDCKQCKAHWEVLRFVGGSDYHLRLLTNGEITKEMALAKWYDQMMEGFVLEPISHPRWTRIDLVEPDERLYLYANIIRCMASPDAVFLLDGTNVLPLDEPQNPFGLKAVGPGELFFSSRRLLFIADDTKVAPFSLPWEELRNADAMMDLAIGTSFGEWTFIFVPKDQSVLKWLAHFHLIVKQLKEEIEHEVYLGYI